jgi:hypothetical protein
VLDPPVQVKVTYDVTGSPTAKTLDAFEYAIPTLVIATGGNPPTFKVFLVIICSGFEYVKTSTVIFAVELLLLITTSNAPSQST